MPYALEGSKVQLDTISSDCVGHVLRCVRHGHEEFRGHKLRSRDAARSSKRAKNECWGWGMMGLC